MAKRRRLTPAQSDYLAPAPAPEVKSLLGPTLAPPIAQVAGEAAMMAALREVTGALNDAQAEGRIVQRLPLAAVEVDHLVRDRLRSDDADRTALRDSIRARGQQTAIEVVDLGPGPQGPTRYGLISGWRRLQALQDLLAETCDPKYGTVQALLRRPDGAADAYLAMVEENEIRVGLSYYERARIAALAAQQGIHPSAEAAIKALFASASRSKRSKIASFLMIHDRLDPVLRFGWAIPERLGLALAQALAEPGFAARLQDRLRKTPAGTEAEELAALSRAISCLPNGQGVRRG